MNTSQIERLNRDTMSNNISQIVSRATTSFIKEQPPDTPAEINNGYCQLFIQYIQAEYELPDGVKIIDACGVHSWFYYHNKHYDAENQDGVDDANNLNIWHDVSDQAISNIAVRCPHIDPPPKTARESRRLQRAGIA